MNLRGRAGFDLDLEVRIPIANLWSVEQLAGSKVELFVKAKDTDTDASAVIHLSSAESEIAVTLPTEAEGEIHIPIRIPAADTKALTVHRTYWWFLKLTLATNEVPQLPENLSGQLTVGPGST